MSEIQHSVHSRDVGVGSTRVGIDGDGSATTQVPGQLIASGGLRSGSNGNQIDAPSPSTIVWFDDFNGDLVGDEWSYVETDADGTGLILDGGIGGVFRITTGNDDANDVHVTNLGGLTGGALQWQAANGGLTIQARIKVSRITDAYMFVGFTDLVTVEVPIEKDNGTDDLTTTASDAVGLMFDSGATTTGWTGVGVAGDTDATALETGTAPVAADYTTVRIEIDPDGNAKFFINGISEGSVASAVTAATDLTPCVYASNMDGTTAVTLDVDYVMVSMNRAADGGAL